MAELQEQGGEAAGGSTTSAELIQRPSDPEWEWQKSSAHDGGFWKRYEPFPDYFSLTISVYRDDEVNAMSIEGGGRRYKAHVDDGEIGFSGGLRVAVVDAEADSCRMLAFVKAYRAGKGPPGADEPVDVAARLRQLADIVEGSSHPAVQRSAGKKQRRGKPHVD